MLDGAVGADTFWNQTEVVLLSCSLCGFSNHMEIKMYEPHALPAMISLSKSLAVMNFAQPPQQLPEKKEHLLSPYMVPFFPVKNKELCKSDGDLSGNIEGEELGRHTHIKWRLEV